MKTPSLAIIFALAAVASPVAARAAEAPPHTVQFEIGAVSDYRYRGYSLSNDKAAVQGGATVLGPAGFYAGAWASTIAEYGVGPDGDGAKVELDLSIGRAFSVGAYDLDAGVTAYTYPDGSHVSYVELPVSIARTAGDWTWTVGAAFAPAQNALGKVSNTYLYGSTGWSPEGLDWSVTALAGHESGAFSPAGKWDWQVGVERSFGPVALGLAYSDADAPGAKAAAVASIKVVF